MALNTWDSFDRYILRQLLSGPAWCQQFPKMKSLLDSLVKRGYVKRVPAPGAKAPLQVEITDAGKSYLTRLKKRAALPS